MAPQVQPLDETEFDQPWLLHELPGGNLNTNSILWYFMNSPFYDRTCNNSALFNQLRNDPNSQETLWNRQLFEERLYKYPAGVRFVVSGEPQGAGEPWVVQKQFKYPDPETGKPVVEVQGTYYTQGTRVLPAPSLLDIIQLRMLAVSTQCQELFEASKELSHFSPATGHTYLPPSYEVAKASTASRLGSRAGSPSLTATEPADAPPSQQAQAHPTEASAETTEFSDSLFLQSLRLTNEYFHEYMDENPLQGEPGRFIYKETYGAVDARNKAQEQQQQQQQQQQQAAQIAAAAGEAAPPVPLTIKTETQSTANSGAATPKTGAATPTADLASRKASIISLAKPGKEKRRKSKGLGSPVTPTAP